MVYEHMVPGEFLSRPNRFIAHVRIDGREEICHVKNTGRCRELLQPGVQVWCQKSSNPKRKTAFDLICVQKGARLINMDSQAPNAAAKEWLLSGALGPVTGVRSEFTHGDSRFDLTFFKDGMPQLMEVKGVTLEHDGICAFPDAPTARGAKHLRGLIQAAQEGYGAWVLFVIQMSQVEYLHPNDTTDPAFAAALREAAQKGVKVLAVECAVTPDSMTVTKAVKVRL